MKADLHCHTIHSDGIYSVYDTCLLAKERNINVLAITDHDTLDGYKSYLDVKDKLPIK